MDEELGKKAGELGFIATYPTDRASGCSYLQVPATRALPVLWRGWMTVKLSLACDWLELGGNKSSSGWFPTSNQPNERAETVGLAEPRLLRFTN